MKAKDNELYLFSNGTEFMVWLSRNCDKCVKAVFYDEKKDYYPKYRCAVQKHIEEAAITDGCGNKRDYEATHSLDCPYKISERKPKKKKKDPNQLELEL
jgi:hypothetical protein